MVTIAYTMLEGLELPRSKSSTKDQQTRRAPRPESGFRSPTALWCRLGNGGSTSPIRPWELNEPLAQQSGVTSADLNWEVLVSQSHDDKETSAPADVAALLANDAARGRWVIDPTGSRAEFHVKHFWGAITVHGSLGQITGEGNLGPDSALTGQLSIDAASLNTRNKRLDKHLRSADFFDVENHPQVVVTVTNAKPTGPATLACQGTLEAAGHVRPIEFTAHLEEANARAVTLRAEPAIDRTEFDMTWSPIGVASNMARTTMLARFVQD